jgi:hypothetical protein
MSLGRSHDAARRALVLTTTKDRHSMGSNTPKKNRSAGTIAERTLIEGFQKHAAALPGVVIGGAWRPTGDLTAIVQGRIDVSKEALTARAAWLAALEAERDNHEVSRTMLGLLRQAILVAFHGQIDVLADFGLTPRKARVDPPEAKIASAAKAKATRAARHTMGSRQRAAIKGVVD